MGVFFFHGSIIIPAVKLLYQYQLVFNVIQGTRRDSTTVFK